MKIKNHRLFNDDDTQFPFVKSPNLGGAVDHRFLVMHFTAGRNFDSSVSWLTNPAAKASAHLVIGRDGRITQLVPFDRIAWHAGKSSWQGLSGLNQFSLGIELDNPGVLTRQGNRWLAWFGEFYDSTDVIEAVHKNETQPKGWLTYTPRQLEVALDVALLLTRRYQLEDILGHDDISPGRKTDPGPAFPLASFRGRLFGRSDDSDLLYETTANLNIRSGPGTTHLTLPGSPLAPGTRVQVLREDGQWRFVDVMIEIEGIMDLQGWVHGRFLRLLG